VVAFSVHLLNSPVGLNRFSCNSIAMLDYN
jgi:hypothetical protein